MLQVIATAEATACTITVDDYVPLSWRCTDAPAPLYWRTGDLALSLLEIGLVPESGLLCRVTVVSATGRLRPDDGRAEAYVASAAPRAGLPRCDTRPWLDRHAWPDMDSWTSREGPWLFAQLRWEERIMDEAVPFTLSVSAEGVSLWLGDPVPVAVCYVTPTLSCGVSHDGGLRLLHFGGLQKDERARIVATINAT
jgi:hypothetical protein